jgi:hypothetical protein
MTKPGLSPGHADDSHLTDDVIERTAGLAPMPSMSPAVLRELAAIIEAREPRRRAIAALSPEKLEELADMLIAGKRPTVGWWQRARAASRAEQ